MLSLQVAQSDKIPAVLHVLHFSPGPTIQVEHFNEVFAGFVIISNAPVLHVEQNSPVFTPLPLRVHVSQLDISVPPSVHFI